MRDKAVGVFESTVIGVCTWALRSIRTFLASSRLNRLTYPTIPAVIPTIIRRFEITFSNAEEEDEEEVEGMEGEGGADE